MADEIGTELTKPRAVTISRFRSNCGVDTTDAGNAETYYRRNVCYPFIDHCIKNSLNAFLNHHCQGSLDATYIQVRYLKSQVQK